MKLETSKASKFGARSRVLSSVTLVAAVLGAAGVSLMVACGGDDEAPPSATAAAEQYFSTKVYPELSKNCGSCHTTGKSGAPIFLADNAAGSYKAIAETPGYISAPTASPVAQKGLHSGPALTTDQGDLVTEWLNQEVEARKLDKGSNKPPNLRAAFTAFGECMSYKVWRQLNLDKIATVVTANGACISCHANGQGSLKLTANPGETFTALSQFPYVQRLVTGTVTNSGSFSGLEPAQRILQKGIEQREANANPHPSYTLSYVKVGDQYVDLAANLRTYVNGTLSRMSERKCEGDQPPPPDGGLDGAPTP